MRNMGNNESDKFNNPADYIKILIEFDTIFVYHLKN